MEPIDEIFDVFGGPTAIAEATGIKVQTVCDWRKKGPKNIPAWRRPAVLEAAKVLGKPLSDAALRYLAMADAA